MFIMNYDLSFRLVSSFYNAHSDRDENIIISDVTFLIDDLVTGI